MKKKLVAATCSHCGHSVLSHRAGLCKAFTMPAWGKHLQPCNCTAIQPPNSQPIQQKLKVT